MLVIGTTGAVYPAAGLPESAIASGVPVIEINLDPSPISSAAAIFLQVRGLPRLTSGPFFMRPVFHAHLCLLNVCYYDRDGQRSWSQSSRGWCLRTSEGSRLVQHVRTDSDARPARATRTPSRIRADYGQVVHVIRLAGSAAAGAAAADIWSSVATRFRHECRYLADSSGKKTLAAGGPYGGVSGRSGYRPPKLVCVCACARAVKTCYSATVCTPTHTQPSSKM
jgi:hypothetical protein